MNKGLNFHANGICGVFCGVFIIFLLIMGIIHIIQLIA